MDDATLQTMIQRAAKQHAALVDPADRTEASSQPKGPSKLARAAFLAGMGADVGSTAYFQSHPELDIHETNPLVNRFPIAAQLPIGAGMEFAAYLVGKKLLKRHPKIMNGLLMGAGAVHGGFAANNLRVIHRQQKKRDQ